ncbi:MAG: putative glycosyl transferase [Caulobacteraceae bacterium]|nr:putative glycosyl transferase [Caulobacteraceae bacterium]
MRSVAFFGHNSDDAAVRRRAVAFQNAGIEVVGFMMRREEPAIAPTWRNIDLGLTSDARYAQRLARIVTGAITAARHRDLLASADIIYARNLDMLLCADLARRLSGVKTPLVYECLDIHALLTREDAIGRMMRRLEAGLLRRTALVVISSPGFQRDYFAVRHPGLGRFFLAENRLIEGDAFGQRPANPDKPIGRPLRIGWFGNLRCPVSIEVLEAVKDRCGEKVEIVLRGYFTEQTQPLAEARLLSIGKATYGGRYRAPQDLQALYEDVDLVWAGDYFEAGMNSLWLLPNRIYEGGYFGVPAIAPSDAETGRWIAQRQAGFAAPEPTRDSVPELIEGLVADPAPITAARAALLRLPISTFVEPRGFIGAVIDAARSAI